MCQQTRGERRFIDYLRPSPSEQFREIAKKASEEILKFPIPRDGSTNKARRTNPDWLDPAPAPDPPLGY